MRGNYPRVLDQRDNKNAGIGYIHLHCGHCGRHVIANGRPEGWVGGSLDDSMRCPKCVERGR